MVNSLRLRLAAAGGAAVLVALAVAAVGLDFLFERHLERLAELAFDLDELAAALELDPRGKVALAAEPTDRRFAQPLSGHYWQVEADGAMFRSRSLWDQTLPLPSESVPTGAPRELTLEGPLGETVLVLERRLTLGDRTARAAVAIVRSELQAAARAFVKDLAPYLAVLALALTAAGWVQLAVGLRPLAALGDRVARVRSGAVPRLGSDFPDEVRPLAAEVDALIDAREAELARARARAADLAHGLKTPLQALVGEADRLRARDARAAAGIEEIAEAIRRHVDRELARARIASRARVVTTDPARIIDRLLAVIRRTRDGARVTWQLDAPPGLTARIDPDDLTEALGALLDNAARHARSHVAVSASRSGAGVTIRVRDDGPGIPDDRLADLTLRGVRLDQAGPGAGLGLSIAHEIADAAGGTLLLDNTGTGLEARLVLPDAS
jgi:signal transduction histidine kinase